MKKNYLNNLKWVVVIIVLICHVILSYNNEGLPGCIWAIPSDIPQYQNLFLYICEPWIMGCMFMASGVSARYSLKKRSGKEFFIKQTNSLLVPGVLGLFTFFFIQGYVIMKYIIHNWNDLQGAPIYFKYFIMAINGSGVLWFIQCLWLFSLGLLLIRRLEKDRISHLVESGKCNILVLLLLGVPYWVSAQLFNTPLFENYKLGVYFFSYLIGYYVLSYDSVIDTLKKHLPLITVLTCVLGIAHCYNNFGRSILSAPINRSFPRCAYSWISCLFVFGFFAKYINIDNKFTAWITKRSFGLYLFHYFGVAIAAICLIGHTELPIFVIYASTIICGFIIGLALNAIIPHIPFFRWCIMGISANKKS